MGKYEDPVYQIMRNHSSRRDRCAGSKRSADAAVSPGLDAEKKRKRLRDRVAQRAHRRNMKGALESLAPKMMAHESYHTDWTNSVYPVAADNVAAVHADQPPLQSSSLPHGDVGQSATGSYLPVCSFGLSHDPELGESIAAVKGLPDHGDCGTISGLEQAQPVARLCAESEVYPKDTGEDGALSCSFMASCVPSCLDHRSNSIQASCIPENGSSTIAPSSPAMLDSSPNVLWRCLDSSALQIAPENGPPLSCDQHLERAMHYSQRNVEHELCANIRPSESLRLKYVLDAAVAIGFQSFDELVVAFYTADLNQSLTIFDACGA
ncbi:hypothetical protein K461DRAFT_276669 [Myriangium duriaei CBS 260.36]|uniref:BZIP domain-containing protein n=1 Tax=Myriangium duriaei CBS 260.36 TaxID=1168546 RepID=A0A9P4J7F3_9PEZI|nr:hypothetical protein K461DRAFT_276669 [Myriangium duriaei CBS 260.36]